jgi:hypothetical protein
MAASQLFFAHCSPATLQLSHDISIRSAARQNIQLCMGQWLENLNNTMCFDAGPRHHLTLTLHMIYQYIQNPLVCHDHNLRRTDSSVQLLRYHFAPTTATSFPCTRSRCRRTGNHLKLGRIYHKYNRGNDAYLGC